MPRDDHDASAGPGPRRRLAWSVALAAGALLIATVFVPTYADQGGPAAIRSGADLLRKQHDASATRAVQGPGAAQARSREATVAEAIAESLPHTHRAARIGSGDGHGHDHSDPTTKNAVSRSTGDTVAADTTDPTTAREAARARKVVAAQRAEPEPTLVPVPQDPPRRAVPEDRYAMAGGCYALQSTRTGRWVGRRDDGFTATAPRRSGADPFHFQATDLGTYLLLGSRKDFLSGARGTGASGNGPGGVGPEVGGLNDLLGLDDTDRVIPAEQPGRHAEWTVTSRGAAYLFRLDDGRGLAVERGTLQLSDRADGFALRRTTGCAHWPEVQVNVTGRTFRGTSPAQEVRGYLDAHTHGMAFEFLGGDVHCGRPWHKYGVAYALRDCPDHRLANGNGAVLENVLRSGTPVGSHDPVGWPTFRDWPAPDSLTHEGTYYKWLERAWRGGLRLFVNLLVENGKLCEVYPLKHNSCDDMDSIRLQARDMRRLERYIDAQSGGPGEGWYRIVTNPFQARKVINQGKLAVVMGIETSVLFGCTMKADVPECTAADIDRQLAAVHKLGVRQMELVNKFDNALSGVAGDEGTTGVAVNAANFLETGSFWDMRSCPTDYAAEVHDKKQIASPSGTPFSERDALFGVIQQQFGVAPPALPLYAAAPHCNRRGLTDLGAHTIREMVQHKMIFDPDHMSVAARKASLDLLESLGYSGVVSSHSWSTPDAYPRIYRLGGVVTPYAGDSTGFVDKWRRHLGWADGRYYFGFGYGADINGLGAQGDPRGAHVSNPVTYPFTGLGGVTVDRQHSGRRVYDINIDGVAHYGLYPDWIEDLRRIAGSRIVEDLARGPEAYLQMWERAVGVDNDGCRDPAALKPVRVFRGIDPGTSLKRLLLQAGQPHRRLDDTYTYCARTRSGKPTTVRVVLDDRARVHAVRG